MDGYIRDGDDADDDVCPSMCTHSALAVETPAHRFYARKTAQIPGSWENARFSPAIISRILLIIRFVRVGHTRKQGRHLRPPPPI